MGIRWTCARHVRGCQYSIDTESFVDTYEHLALHLLASTLTPILSHQTYFSFLPFTTNKKLTPTPVHTQIPFLIPFNRTRIIFILTALILFNLFFYLLFDCVVVWYGFLFVLSLVERLGVGLDLYYLWGWCWELWRRWRRWRALVWDD